MRKLIAIVNVVAWSGFWAFGYLALTAHPDGGQVLVALLLAGAGLITGSIAFMMLSKGQQRPADPQRPGPGSPTQEQEV